jgi:hypothetical protein
MPPEPEAFFVPFQNLNSRKQKSEKKRQKMYWGYKNRKKEVRKVPHKYQNIVKIALK